ncbi:MAG: protein translocase subunit SecF [Candidatus Woesearchaeota archaeon]
MSRRERRILRRQGKKYKPDETLEAKPGQAAVTSHEHSESHKGAHKKGIANKLLHLYEHNYKRSMWFTIILLVISILIIGVHTAVTGEVIPRGVSLKGGVTITVPYEGPVEIDDLQNILRSEFPQSSIQVRSMKRAGVSLGFIVDASDVDGDVLLEQIKSEVGEIDKFSLETMGSALGQAFFTQTLLAILIAFVLMSIVVFLSFKTFIPSFAVILSAVSDILMTVAVIDLFQIRIETAGIAALLMLIGYSVDTDVLLTTRILKREEGTVFDRLIGAMKTGLTMTFTSIAAIAVSLIFTQSETLRQIMLILLIGLFFDIINTWIQNAGILRMYMEYKAKKRTSATLADYNENVVDADFEENER